MSSKERFQTFLDWKILSTCKFSFLGDKDSALLFRLLSVNSFTGKLSADLFKLIQLTEL